MLAWLELQKTSVKHIGAKIEWLMDHITHPYPTQHALSLVTQSPYYPSKKSQSLVRFHKKTKKNSTNAINKVYSAWKEDPTLKTWSIVRLRLIQCCISGKYYIGPYFNVRFTLYIALKRRKNQKGNFLVNILTGKSTEMENNQTKKAREIPTTDENLDNVWTTKNP